MKIKIIKSAILCSFFLSTSIFAVADGGYVGLELGMGNTLVKGSNKTTTSNTGLAGGIFTGYQFNNNGGIEFGYTHYANGTSPNAVTCGSSVIHNDSVNLLGKGILPIGPSGISLFAKGGFGVLRSSGGGSCSVSNKKTTVSLKPVIAIGASYDLSQQWVADISYKRMFVNSTQVSNLNIIALGISYHFVDVYCGQFLC